MTRRMIIFFLLILTLAAPVRAETIKWVDFGVPFESLKYAMDQDIVTFDQEDRKSVV